MTKLYMRDFLTFKVQETDPAKKFLHECKDSNSESGYSLLTHVDATHSGKVNGNLRFYRPDKMANSVHTWGANKRTQRPVLAHHDEQSDPLGRVATWKYIDLRHEYLGKHGQINNLLFYDAVSNRKMDLFKSVNWVYDNLQRKNSDYTGLGKIQLGLNVTNPEAIGKIQRGEYATVSVGFKTDEAFCSVCHQDWAEDGRCDHKLGATYDGQRCFIISGNFEYEELSFVTFPADTAGCVVNAEMVQQAKDSMALRVFLLGQPLSQTPLVLTDAVEADYTDMLASDIHVVTDTEDQDDMELDAIRSEVAGTDLTKERALELRKELAGNKDAKQVLTRLNARIRKNQWDAVASAAPTKEEIEAKLVTLEDTLAVLSHGARKSYLERMEADAALYGLTIPVIDNETLESPAIATIDELPVEDRAFFEQGEDTLYEQMFAAEEGKDSLVDAKLSTEARKKLKPSSFCGPNKSFPVADCNHVTAAKRFIGRAKVSADTKNRISACIDRKAKSLGCGGSKDAVDEQDSSLEELRLKFKDSKDGANFVELIDKAGDMVAALPAEEQYTALRYIYQKWDILGDEQNLAWMKQRLSAVPEETDQPSVGADQLQELEDCRAAIDSYQSENEALRSSLDAARSTSRSMLGKMKRTLATTIVSHSVLAKEPGFVGLSADQITQEIEVRTQRQLTSLEDSLTDLSKRLSLVTVPEGTVQAPEATTARPIDDTATVKDTTEQPEAASIDEAATADAPRGEKKAAPILSLRQLRETNKLRARDAYQAVMARQKEKE